MNIHHIEFNILAANDASVTASEHMQSSGFMAIASADMKAVEGIYGDCYLGRVAQ